MAHALKFFFAPNSRAMSILWLLEELGVPYDTEIVDINGEGGAPERYRAIQPHKKVPAIQHEGAVITERAAISIYLTERFPEAHLAPPVGDPKRGPFLSWMVYVDAVVDPALSAKGLGFQYTKRSTSYGSFDDMLAHVERTLTAQPYALGDAFSAVDTQLGTAIYWALELAKVFPDKPVFRDYLKRLAARPAFQRHLTKTF